MATLLNETQITWARPRVADYPSAEAKALEGELKNRIEGEVRFDDGSRALYATDGSNYSQVPIEVVATLPVLVVPGCLRQEIRRRRFAP